MPRKDLYDRLKAERPDVWQARMFRDQEKAKALRLARFPIRHPGRATDQQCRVCHATFTPRRRGGNIQVFCSKRCQISDMNHKRRLRCPDRVKLGLRKLAAKRRLAWRAYMVNQRCARCAENHPGVLDHHHIDPKTKSFPIGMWLAHRFEEVMVEAAKCIVLCSNCHRKLEWEKKHQKLEVA